MKLSHLIETTGLYRGLDIYPDLDSALRASPFRKVMLSGVRAFVFSEDQTCGLLSGLGASPLLDVLGKPFLQRVFERLHGSGCKQIFASTSHHAEVAAYFSSDRVPGQSQFFVGPDDASTRVGLGDRLRDLQDAHTAFANSFLVVKGDVLTDLDWSEFYDFHCSEGADISFLSNSPSSASAISECGLVLHPQCSDLFSGVMSVKDCHDRAVQEGLRIALYPGPHQDMHSHTYHQYYQLLTDLLQRPHQELLPVGHEARPGVWMADGAYVSVDAQVEGPVYLGRGVEVSRHAKIIGPAILGEQVSLGHKSLLRMSVLGKGTVVPQGALIDGKFVAHGVEASLRSAETVVPLTAQEDNPVRYADAMERRA